MNDDFYIFNDLKSMPIYEVPTRLDTTVLSVCLDGYTRIGVNMQEYYVGPGSLIIALPDQIIHSMEISDDYQGIVIAISRKYTDEVFPKIKVILPFFFYTKEYPCLNLEGNELSFIMEYYNLFWERINEDRRTTKEIILTLITAMFYEIYNIYDTRIPRKTEKRNRKEVIYDQFMRLLSENYRKERSVNYYAKALCLTPKHLSSVVKKTSGRTAGEWIDNFVIFEAKSLLRSSQLNIQEIADELNFANQSFFGKYFKHYTGMSPKEFRRS
ncbi:AraC family transcriptional regulator [Bacteroides sp. 519]|uniref:helix-turn-helix domain-containing protein n=1 Tax=Bacteroides sp. 519 TaxID=2302937 RepID=UPI001EF34C83|nr:helix-turn-helix domain-containing protein [Bacteroides sp. 519]